MIRVSQQEWETFKRHKEPEVFTESAVNGWILSHQETILKGDLEELNDIEKAEVDSFNTEFGSLMKVEVISTSDDPLTKGLKYETFYVREKQIEFEKAEEDEIQKSRHGKYLDTPLNRKMGRVGREFGSKRKEGYRPNDSSGPTPEEGELDGEDTSNKFEYEGKRDGTTYLSRKTEQSKYEGVHKNPFGEGWNAFTHEGNSHEIKNNLPLNYKSSPTYKTKKEAIEHHIKN